MAATASKPLPEEPAAARQVKLVSFSAALLLLRVLQDHKALRKAAVF